MVIRALPLVLAAALAGCQQIKSAMDQIEKPTARVAGVRFGDLSTEDLTLIFDVEVSNPYAFDLRLAGLDYELSSKGRSFVSGSSETKGVVAAGGSRTLPLAAKVRFADVLATVEGIRPGKLVPYEAALTLKADAPGVGPLALPLRQTGELPVPAVPRVALTSVEWERLSFQEAKATLNLDVTNTNEFEVDLGRMAYDLSLAGKRVGGGGVDKGTKFRGGQTRPLTVPLSFSPAGLGAAALNVLRGDRAEYHMAGSMDLATPFGPLSMPYDSSGVTSFRR